MWAHPAAVALDVLEEPLRVEKEGSIRIQEVDERRPIDGYGDVQHVYLIIAW
jgi:hypothetical protein